jgi:hypothetical protein
MSYAQSFTESTSVTFTVTHARHMAAKVATDLKRMQRFYGKPDDAALGRYEAEVIELLRLGYLGTVAYGFRRDSQWIEPMLKYTARDLLGGSTTDDDPGRIRPGADVNGASFYSYLTYNSAWNALTYAQKEAIERQLPIQRGNASEPAANGYLSGDLIYSSGGRALHRASLRSFT